MYNVEKKEKNIHAQLKKINENKVEIKKKKVLKKKIKIKNWNNTKGLFRTNLMYIVERKKIHAMLKKNKENKVVMEIKRYWKNMLCLMINIHLKNIFKKE